MIKGNVFTVFEPSKPSLTIDTNGTFDITNYKNIDVKLPGVISGKDVGSLLDRTITSVTAPCSSIGTYAFANCFRLNEVNFPECSYIGSSAFGTCYALTSISFPECITIFRGAFFNCFSLASVTFPKCRGHRSFF